MIPALLIAVAAGALSALPLIIAASEPGGLLLLLLAPLPIFAAGLAQGAIGSAIAGGTVLVIAALLAGVLAAAGALLFLVAPSVLLVRQALLNRPAAAGAAGGTAGGAPALEWYPPGLLVTWLLWIGLAWLAVTLALLAGEPGGMQAAVRASLEQALGLSLPGIDPADIGTVADRLAGFALGFGVVSWLFMLALNGCLAQGALVSFGRNLRPSPDLADIVLPGWIAPALAAVLLGAFLLPGDLGFAAKNLAPLLMLPFFFAGLAVIHAYARRASAGRLLLVLFYTLLVLFSWPAAIVVFLGLFDQWADLRRRLTARTPGQEEE